MIIQQSNESEDLGHWINPDHTLRRTSATRIKLFSPDVYGGCMRRWWLSESGPGGQLYGVPPEPQQNYLSIGTEVHAQIERYEKTGINTLLEVAMSGFRFILPPGPDLAVEHPIITLKQIETKTAPLQPYGVPMSGKIDLFHRRGYYIDDDGIFRREPPRTAELMDWKTSSNIAQYGKTGLQLIDDIQMTTYAWYMLLIWPDLEWIRFSHGYFQTRGKRHAEKRTALVPVATVRRNWQHNVERRVGEMGQVARITNYRHVEPQYDSCGAYSGCPRRAMCPRTTRQILFGNRSSVNQGEHMSLVDAVRAGQGQPPQFGQPQQMQQAPQFGAPQQAPQFGAPQGQLQQDVAALQAEEQRLRAAHGSMTPSPAQFGQPQPMPWQPQQEPQAPQFGAPQQAPQFGAPQQAPQFGAPQQAPQFGAPQQAPQFGAPGVGGAPQWSQPPQILPPDAPQSQPHLAANPIPSETLQHMPPQLQQAHAAFFGQQPQGQAPFGAAPQSFAPQGAIPGQVVDPPKGEKCRASGVSIQITQDQAMRRAMQCPGGCGQTIQLKPEQVAGNWIAKIKRHHHELPPSQGAPAAAAPASAPASDGLSLYIDVALQGVQATDLEQYFQNCCRSIQQTPNWKNDLANVARQYPPSGVCFLTGVAQNEAKQVIIEAIRPLAKLYVAPQR